jgi:hypothetical protein
MREIRLSKRIGSPHSSNSALLISANTYQLIEGYFTCEALGEQPRGALRAFLVDAMGKLVENARKYAPVDFTQPNPEPILVVVFAPDGTPIGRIALPERCANVCFGGLKRNRLFMAASQSLYALYVNTQGVQGG